MALSPEYQRILDLMRMRGDSELDRTREDRLAPLYERVGLRSPQVAAKEEEAVRDMVNRLSDAEIDLLYRQVVRGEQLEDADAARQFQTGMFGRQTAAQSRLAGEQAGHQMELQDARSAHERELLELQRQWQLDDQKRAQKEAQKSALTNLLVSTGIGMATGGLGFLPGVSSGLSGMALGGLMGGPAAGQAAAFNLFQQPQQASAQQTPLQFGSPQQSYMWNWPSQQQTSLYPDWMSPGRRSSWL